MQTENWVCNACSKTNAMGLNKCSSCGCPKGASGEVTEKFRDPEGYKNRKASKSLHGIIAMIVMSPIFMLTAIYQGKLEVFAIFVASVFVSVIADKAFLKSVASSKWAQVTILTFFIFNFVAFSLRLAFDGQLSDPAIYLYTAAMLVCFSIFFVYVKMSRQGQEFLNDYKSRSQS